MTEDKNIKYIRGLVREALWSVKYHQEELSKAHLKLSYAKAMMLRGNYTEFSIDEVKAALDKEPEDDEDE